jgi:hypothetical protein
MKQRSFLPVVLSLVASLALVGFRSLAAPGDAAVRPTVALPISPSADDGVWICHFNSHDGPNSPDFVTFFAPPNTFVCTDEGGNPIHVGRAACWNGHQAIARFGKDCDTTDQP